MASAQRRSGTRGRPPPKRWRFSRTGMSGSSTAQSASETRKAVVVRLFGVRTRVRLVDVVSFMLWSIPGYSDRLLVVLDYLVLIGLRPSWGILPGTEDMTAEYCDYRFHFIGFLKG